MNKKKYIYNVFFSQFISLLVFVSDAVYYIVAAVDATAGVSKLQIVFIFENHEQNVLAGCMAAMPTFT